MEFLWDHEEYRGLHRVIEEVIATHIEQLLATNAAALIKQGMAGGFFSSSLLRQVLRQKNA